MNTPQKPMQTLIPWALAFMSTIAIFSIFAKEEVFAILSAPQLDCAIKSSSRLNGGSVLFLGIFLFSSIAAKSILEKSDKRTVFWAAIFGAAFSLLGTAGSYISAWNDLETILRGNLKFVFVPMFAVGFAGCAIVFSLLCMFFSLMLKNLESIPACSPPLRPVLFYFCVLAVCWGAFAYLYGLAMPFDTMAQISQGTFCEPLSDNNPMFLSLLIGAFARFGGAVFGSMYLGIEIFAIVQMCLLAFAAAYALFLLQSWKAPQTLIYISLAFYALHPFIGAYAFTPIKDVWIASFILLYMLFLFDKAVNGDELRLSPKKILALAAFILGMLLSKKTGSAIFLFSLPFAIFLFKGERIKFAAVSISVFAIFQLMQSFMFCFAKVSEGELREMLSAPLQQVARTVSKYESELSGDERQAIGEILPLNDIPRLYNPALSDPIKSKLRADVFAADKIKYAKLWLKLATKYPLTYLESFMLGTIGYWYPDVIYGTIAHDSYMETLQRFKSEGRPYCDANPPEQSKTFFMARLYKAIYAAKTIPLLSLLFSIGFFFWIALLCVYQIIIERAWKLLLPLSLLLAAWITCMLSPVHAELRYSLAIFLSVPVLLCLLSVPKIRQTRE